MCGSGHRNLSPGAGPDWTDRSIFRKKPWRTCPVARPPSRRKAPALLPETLVLRRFPAMPPPSPSAVPGPAPVGKRVQSESTREYYLLHIVPDRPAVVRDSARDSARDGAQSRGRVAMCREMSCFVMVRFSSSAPSPPVISTGANRSGATGRGATGRGAEISFPCSAPVRSTAPERFLPFDYAQGRPLRPGLHPGLRSK